MQSVVAIVNMHDTIKGVLEGVIINQQQQVYHSEIHLPDVADAGFISE